MFSMYAFANEERLMEPYPPNFAAENFQLPDIEGKKHSLNDFEGRFLLVNFWTMSCNVCKGEMTTLQSAYEILGEENLVVVSIHAGKKIDGAKSVVELNKITYPVLVDAELVMGHWGIPILPTTFLVDPIGNIRYRAVGTRVWNSPFMIDFLQAEINNSKNLVSVIDKALN